MRSRLASLVVLGAVVASACSADEAIADDRGFWSMLVFVGEPVESFSSVSEMAAAADLIIAGTVFEVTAGREWGDIREAENRVASILFQVGVDDVLGGELPTDSPVVTWEYVHPAYGLSQLQSHLTGDGFLDPRTDEVQPLPTGRVLLFLRARDDFGTEIATAPDAVFVGDTAYRLVSVGGLVVESPEGAALPIMGMEAESPDGRDLIAEVESITLDEVIDTLTPDA